MPLARVVLRCAQRESTADTLTKAGSIFVTKYGPRTDLLGPEDLTPIVSSTLRRTRTQPLSRASHPERMNRRRRQSCARSTGGRTPASCPQFTRHPPGASSPRLARLLSIAPRLRLCAAGARGGGGLEAVENRGSGGYRPSPQRGCTCPQVLSPAESGGDGSDMLCLLARLNANVRGREGPAEKPQRPTPNRVRISRRPRLVTSSARLSRSWTTHFRVSAIFRSAAPKAPPTCGVRSVQSRQANANRRRSVRMASTSMPRAPNAFTPSRVRSYVLSPAVDPTASHPRA